MFLKRLECSACGLEHEWSRLQKSLSLLQQTAVCDRRSRRGESNAVPRDTALAGKITLALSGSVAFAIGWRAGLVR
jgi:hypothetical protein